MAKPKHGRWNNHPTPRCRAHPSPAVLAALALIATAPPVVAGHPVPTTPPPFLCPFIDRDLHLLTHRPRTPSSSSSASSPTPAPQQTGPRAVVADKYVEGPDNLWRKTDAWTLYGSTCCSSSTASASAAQSQPTTSQIPMPTSTLSTVEFDTSVLPAGWVNTTNISSNTESSIILALAIILAGSICVFMIGCLVWRRRKKRSRDIERKLAHKLSADDNSQDIPREKDARGKMRMWARASSRWKSNIRQSARRRRKRPIVSSTLSRPLSPTFSDSRRASVVAPSALSRRGSFMAEESDPSGAQAASSPNHDVIQPPPVQNDLPRPASPPTYGASFVSRFSRPPPSSAGSSPALRLVQRSNQPPIIEDEPIPYVLPSHGHVATDDKAQLARIRELASSPSATDDAASQSSLQPVSAPEWHEVDDDLEDLGIDLSQVPMPIHEFDLPPSFPPPPCKADVPFGHLDDRPLHYREEGNMAVSLPVPGSPRPSLEASPSAPPIDETGLEPSAPSLEGEDDLFQDWEGTSSYVPGASNSGDLNSASVRVEESIAPPTAPSVSHASFSSVRESAARDGILPRYRP